MKMIFVVTTAFQYLQQATFSGVMPGLVSPLFITISNRAADGVLSRCQICGWSIAVVLSRIEVHLFSVSRVVASATASNVVHPPASAVSSASL